MTSREVLQELGTPQIPALGFIELSSIARGLFLTDTLVKKAPVRIIASQPVSSGKHVILYMGDVACVEESHRAALENAEGAILRQILIPAIHSQLPPFLDSLWSTPGTRALPGEAIGIAESTSMAGAILAADAALKAARVFLCRLHLGQGIGGKAFFILSGRHEEVEAGLEAADHCLRQMDSLCRIDLIPRPQEEALPYF